MSAPQLLPGSPELRAEFPILQRSVHKRPLVYLDNAATSQKPRAVIAKLVECYEHWNSNVHRGVHRLSEEATEHYEGARQRIARHLGANTAEIVFTRGATESINLVAQSFGRAQVQAGDEVLITALEHHSNIVPWQLLCRERGAKLKVVPITDAGELVEGAFASMLTPRTRLAAFTWVSNALGTVNPVNEMCALARARGVTTLVDACQAVQHFPVNVQTLGADFLVFSGHKVYAPNGSGVLYGRRALLEAMPPWQGGGDMIASVTFEESTWNHVPHKFEAGTPDYPAAVGLACALEWLSAIGFDAIAAHEQTLLAATLEALGSIAGVRLVGQPAQRSGVVSFAVDGLHPHDLATVLDRMGVAVRAGHHCAQPVMDRLGVPATTRASFSVFNNMDDVNALAQAVREAKRLFGV
jgi:cysteine desulfurase/selenocysteine lyase